MPAVPLADAAAERVGQLVRSAFVDVLGVRLDALLVHGSAVTGGYIEGFSDFDFVLFMRGRLTADDAPALQARLGEVDHHPFDYLQVSRVVNLEEPPDAEGRRLLIDEGYASLVGDYPTGWPFLDEESLRVSGAEVLAGLPALMTLKRRRWAAATGARRTLEVRYHMTDLKPAVRSMLVEQGEPPLDVWRAPYGELARRWAVHDTERGARLSRLLDALPPTPAGEARVGEEMLALLEEITVARR